MLSNKKEQISKLLKGIETGDPASVSVVNETKYIQHNLQSEGLTELFKRPSKTSPRVNIVRVFEDGHNVFSHTEYDFATRNIAFEIFRFEKGQAVEHWDNNQKRKGPNNSGHSMVDGVTEATDHECTESNRSLIKSFVEDILIQGDLDKSYDYISQDHYTEHKLCMGDDLSRLKSVLSDYNSGSFTSVEYKKYHRLLAEGNFVLSVCDGYAKQIYSSFFDLYRVKDGKIVGHWDTTEEIPPRSEWKNNNGKF